MPRYIDADKLESHKYTTQEASSNDMGGAYRQGWNDAIEAIVDYEPTADVIEVVRCKDCKHRKKNTFCLHNMRYEDDNGFCSYGERGKYEKDN